MRKTLAFLTLMASTFYPASEYITSIFPQSNTYAQEAKEEKEGQKSLIQQVEDEITKLDAKKNKTIPEYLTLIDMRCDFRGADELDQLNTLAQEARKKINNPKKAEQQYLDALLALLAKDHRTTIQIVNTLVEDPKVSPKIKSNALTRFTPKDLKNYENAIIICPTNIAAYYQFFYQYVRDIAKELSQEPWVSLFDKTETDPDGIESFAITRNALLRKHTTKAREIYEKAVKQKTPTAAEKHQLFVAKYRFAELLRFIQSKLEKDNLTPDYINRHKELYKEIRQQLTPCYDSILQMLPTTAEKYEIYTAKGKNHFVMSHELLEGTEHYDIAMDSFEKALPCARTDEEKGQTNYSIGFSAYLKARDSDKEIWNKGQLNLDQLQLGKKAYSRFQEALTYPLPNDQKDRAKALMTLLEGKIGK